MIRIKKLSTVIMGISFALFSCGLSGIDFGLPFSITMKRIGIILISITFFLIMYKSKNNIIFKTNININILIICHSMILVWTLFSILFSPYQSFSMIIQVVKVILTIIIIFIAFQFTEFFIKEHFCNIIVISEFLILIWTIIFIFNRLDATKIFHNPYLIRYLLDNEISTGLNRYLNGLSFLNFFSIAIILRIQKTIRTYYWIAYINVIIFTFLAFFSGSRQTVLALLFFLIVLIIISFIVYKRRARGVTLHLSKIFIVIVLLITFFVGFNEIVKLLDNRYIEKTISDLSNSDTSRFRIYKDSLDYISTYPFFGTGPDTYQKIEGFYTHNAYFYLATSIGIFPIIVIILLFLFIIFQGMRHKKNAINRGQQDLLITSLSFLITVFCIMWNFNDLYFEYTVWIVFVLVIFAIKPNVKGNVKR